MCAPVLQRVVALPTATAPSGVAAAAAAAAAAPPVDAMHAHDWAGGAWDGMVGQEAEQDREELSPVYDWTQYAAEDAEEGLERVDSPAYDPAASPPFHAAGTPPSAAAAASGAFPVPLWQPPSPTWRPPSPAYSPPPLG